MSIIIDLVVIVLLLVMCNENLQKGFWMGVLVAISYPVGTYFNTLSMTKFIGGFNIMHIIPLTILFCWFFKNCKLSFKINLYFVSIIVLILLYVINIFKTTAEINDVVKDSQKYIVALLWLILTKLIFSNENIGIDKFFKVIGLASLINSIIGFIFIFGVDKISSLSELDKSQVMDDSNLALISCSSIYVCVIGRALYIVLNGNIKNHKIEVVAGCTCLLYLLIGTNSRTNLMILLILAIYIFVNAKRKLGIKLIFLVFFIILIFAFFIKFRDSAVITRLLDTNFTATSLMSGKDTLLTRINTIKYYVPLALRKPLGNGFGHLYRIVNQFGRFHGVEGDYFLDNELINTVLKIGPFGLISYIVVLIYPVIFSVKKMKIEKLGYIIMTYLLLLFSGLLMTAQGIKNYQMSIIISILNYIIYNQKSSLKFEINVRKKE